MTIGWVKPSSDSVTSREMKVLPAICLNASDMASAAAPADQLAASPASDAAIGILRQAIMLRARVR